MSARTSAPTQNKCIITFPHSVEPSVAHPRGELAPLGAKISFQQAEKVRRIVGPGELSIDYRGMGAGIAGRAAARTTTCCSSHSPAGVEVHGTARLDDLRRYPTNLGSCNHVPPTAQPW